MFLAFARVIEYREGIKARRRRRQRREEKRTEEGMRRRVRVSVTGRLKVAVQEEASRCKKNVLQRK